MVLAQGERVGRGNHCFHHFLAETLIFTLLNKSLEMPSSMAVPENARMRVIFPYMTLLEIMKVGVQRSFGFLDLLMSKGEMQSPQE